MPNDWRTKIALLFFGMQIALVAQARFVDTRYFCWAPHTTQVHYRLEVEVDGKRLSGKQVHKRYQIPFFKRRSSEGWEGHSIANLKAMLVQYQRTYGKGEDAKITLTYRVNGHPPEVWRWPTE